MPFPIPHITSERSRLHFETVAGGIVPLSRYTKHEGIWAGKLLLGRMPLFWEGRGKIRQILTVKSAVLAKSDAKLKRLHEHGTTIKAQGGGPLSQKLPFFRITKMCTHYVVIARWCS